MADGSEVTSVTWVIILSQLPQALQNIVHSKVRPAQGPDLRAE